jgi:hypothetical protein
MKYYCPYCYRTIAQTEYKKTSLDRWCPCKHCQIVEYLEVTE